MMVEVLLDGGFELGHTLEDTASDSIDSDAAEEALDLVEPRCRRRGEVHVETWMPLKPSLHLGVLVGGVIVSDEVQIQPLWAVAVDGAQKFKPFLVAVALHALPNNPAGGDIEGGKQRRRSIAFVVVGHSPGPPFFHWQAGLRAIQRLDLAFLIDREYQGFVRWIEIKTHDILDLLDEAFVVRQLKGLDQMRLQAVCVPNPLHARVADAERLGQRAGTPVRRGGWLLMQGHFDRSFDHRCREWRFPSTTRSVPLQPGKPARHIAFLPAAHCALALAHRPNDRHLADPVSRQQHNPRSPDQLLRRITVRHPTLQCRPILRRQPDACLRLHARRLAPF